MVSSYIILILMVWCNPQLYLYVFVPQMRDAGFIYICIFNVIDNPGIEFDFPGIWSDVFKCQKERLLHKIFCLSPFVDYLQTKIIYRFIIKFINLQLSPLISSAARFDKLIDFWPEYWLRIFNFGVHCDWFNCWGKSTTAAFRIKNALIRMMYIPIGTYLN